MTIEELNEENKKLKEENNRLKELLRKNNIDYTNENEKILTTDDKIKIYLSYFKGRNDVYAEKYTGNEMDRFNIGTVKSLNEDAETFEKMGQLFGRFVGKAKEFIQENSVDFEFESTILVRSFDAEEKKLLGVYMETEDEVSEYIALKKYPKATKTIKVYDLKKRTAKSLAAWFEKK